MQAKTFKGGIHPKDMKEISMDQPIMTLEPGKEMVFLMSQHIGAPAKPLVKKGDPVIIGQMIGEAGGFVSAPVYSSVSGTVKAVEKRKNALGDMVDAVVIENDGLDTESEYTPAKLDALSPEDIIKRIQTAGVVGMGGAGFPTHVKLSPKEPDKIDHILVNGSECEPYLTSDYRCLLENSDELVKGLTCILKIFPKASGIICIEDNKPEAIAKMREAVKGSDRIRVEVMKTKYPEGAERSLIYAVTGREVNSSMLPADAGCIVNNVDTVIAVYEAVIKGRPLMHRIFTVSGDAVANARNYDVRIGMSYADIIEAAGGFQKEPEKIISGGPMMGFSLFGLDVPVTKTSGAITCFIKDPVKESVPSACIKCGRCVRGCPAHLMPCDLSDIAEHGDKEEFAARYGMECVECGSCSYICPAKRPLASNIKAMRRTLLAERRK